MTVTTRWTRPVVTLMGGSFDGARGGGGFWSVCAGGATGGGCDGAGVEVCCAWTQITRIASNAIGREKTRNRSDSERFIHPPSGTIIGTPGAERQSKQDRLSPRGREARDSREARAAAARARR